MDNSTNVGFVVMSAPFGGTVRNSTRLKQILSIDASFYIKYDRPLADTNLMASVH